jgi:hypothetical protein
MARQKALKQNIIFGESKLALNLLNYYQLSLKSHDLMSLVQRHQKKTVRWQCTFTASNN